MAVITPVTLTPEALAVIMPAPTWSVGVVVIPAVTFIPFLAVINPIASTLVTSSYDNVPPIVTSPLNVPLVAVIAATVIFGVPLNPVALPVKAPTKVVAVTIPAPAWIPVELIVTAVPTIAELNVETPVTLRSLLVVATETPRVAIVAIPEISKFLPVTSS